jgi:hypothetical protein
MRGMSTPKRPKRPADFNQRAYAVFQEAIGESPKQPEPTPEPEKLPEREKDPAAVSLGRRGGLKGGKARVSKMTKEQLSEAARNAANARWRNRKPTDG